MSDIFAIWYVISGVVVASFILGVYAGQESDDPSDLMWVIILGGFWPLVIFGVLTYPLWKNITRHTHD